jgi:hypothetical protein
MSGETRLLLQLKTKMPFQESEGARKKAAAYETKNEGGSRNTPLSKESPSTISFFLPLSPSHGLTLPQATPNCY